MRTPTLHTPLIPSEVEGRTTILRLSTSLGMSGLGKVSS
jgi:hypothetical protein